MALEKKPTTRPRFGLYDWKLFRDACVQNPNEWIREDDPDRPKVNAHQIRRATPKVFEPAGAFDAIYRKSEGTFIRYVGVPIEPWLPWEGTEFDKVVRTFDPARFPEGTPDDVVALAEEHTKKRLRRFEPFDLVTLNELMPPEVEDEVKP